MFVYLNGNAQRAFWNPDTNTQRRLFQLWAVEGSRIIISFWQDKTWLIIGAVHKWRMLKFGFWGLWLQGGPNHSKTMLTTPQLFDIINEWLQKWNEKHKILHFWEFSTLSISSIKMFGAARNFTYNYTFIYCFYFTILLVWWK